MNRQPKLYQRGATGIWWADFGIVGGRRHKLSLRHTDRGAAEREADRLRAELAAHDQAERVRRLTKPDVHADWSAVLASENAGQIFDRLWKNAKSRASTSGLMWALCRKDFDDLVACSNGRCAVTGLPFNLDGSARDPFKPSLDRIDNALGYSAGNCRLVLMAVNLAMNVWGPEVFKAISLSFAARELELTVQRRVK